MYECQLKKTTEKFTNISFLFWPENKQCQYLDHCLHSQKTWLHKVFEDQNQTIINLGQWSINKIILILPIQIKDCMTWASIDFYVLSRGELSQNTNNMLTPHTILDLYL